MKPSLSYIKRHPPRSVSSFFFAKYLGLNCAPPAGVLKNTVPNHSRVPRHEIRPAAVYHGLNSAPPLVILSNI